MTCSAMRLKWTGCYHRVVNVASALRFPWLCRRDDFQMVRLECLPSITAGQPVCTFLSSGNNTAKVFGVRVFGSGGHC